MAYAKKGYGKEPDEDEGKAAKKMVKKAEKMMKKKAACKDKMAKKR